MFRLRPAFACSAHPWAGGARHCPPWRRGSAGVGNARTAAAAGLWLQGVQCVALSVTETGSGEPDRACASSRLFRGAIAGGAAGLECGGRRMVESGTNSPLTVRWRPAKSLGRSPGELPAPRSEHQHAGSPSKWKGSERASETHAHTRVSVRVDGRYRPIAGRAAENERVYCSWKAEPAVSPEKRASSRSLAYDLTKNVLVFYPWLRRR